MTKTKINEKVCVTVLGFRKNLTAYPRCMEYRGVTYNFIDIGLRCLLKCGEKIAEFFTLSDGQAYYHLKLDRESNAWILLSISI